MGFNGNGVITGNLMFVRVGNTTLSDICPPDGNQGRMCISPGSGTIGGIDIAGGVTRPARVFTALSLVRSNGAIWVASVLSRPEGRAIGFTLGIAVGSAT